MIQDRGILNLLGWSFTTVSTVMTFLQEINVILSTITGILSLGFVIWKYYEFWKEAKRKSKP
jgi:hypothetical protein